MRVGAALAFVLALPAMATSVAPLTDRELVDGSELVARVTVLSSASQWVGRRIVTVHEVRVDERWKGQTPDVVTVVLPGGVVDGIGQKVIGAPELVVGSRYVLCVSPPALELGGVKHRGIVGLYQGAWAEQKDGALRALRHDGVVEVIRPELLRARLGIGK